MKWTDFSVAPFAGVTGGGIERGFRLGVPDSGCGLDFMVGTVFDRGLPPY
jgi:hypothetical protein